MVENHVREKVQAELALLREELTACSSCVTRPCRFLHSPQEAADAAVVQLFYRFRARWLFIRLLRDEAAEFSRECLEEVVCNEPNSLLAQVVPCVRLHIYRVEDPWMATWSAFCWSFFSLLSELLKKLVWTVTLLSVLTDIAFAELLLLLLPKCMGMEFIVLTLKLATPVDMRASSAYVLVLDEKYLIIFISLKLDDPMWLRAMLAAAAP